MSSSWVLAMFCLLVEVTFPGPRFAHLGEKEAKCTCYEVDYKGGHAVSFSPQRANVGPESVSSIEGRSSLVPETTKNAILPSRAFRMFFRAALLRYNLDYLVRVVEIFPPNW